MSTSTSPKVDEDTAKKLQEFHRKVGSTAEDVIFKVFPSKILELQELIESTSKPDSPYHLSHAPSFTDITVYPPPSTLSTTDEPEPKKRKRTADSNGVGPGTSSLNDTQYARFPNVVHANKHLSRIHEDIKKECGQLAELCDKVKLWINLTMPKIEDGDNFGVQIQEEVLTELQRSQESAYNLRDGARQGHLNRAKICSKMIKYPHVEDYTLALKEHDDRQLYVARQHIIDIRNVYAVLTDILHKNITKIRVPKANNSVGLY